MFRRAALVPVIALSVLIVYPRPAQVGAPPAQSGQRSVAKPAAPAVTLPSVTVEHQLIQVEPPRPKPAPRIRRVHPSTRLAAAPIDRRAALVVRAGRAFMGDGRFRPEPFPRLDR